MEKIRPRQGLEVPVNFGLAERDQSRNTKGPGEGKDFEVPVFFFFFFFFPLSPSRSGFHS